jgi:hypothetical protein
MTCKFSATAMAESLTVQCDDTDWSFTITRVDGQLYGPFLDFHEKDVTTEDVRKFLPNWQNLKWEEASKATGGQHEYAAKDKDFKVSLVSTLSDEQMIKEFTDWLGAAR